MKSKYNGIDSREIKCCCDNPQCIEAGISIDENQLVFHFLDFNSIGHIIQISKSMQLNKENTQQLIAQLKQLKFK